MRSQNFVNQMKIVSWNINSLRLRLELLAEFVAQNRPDIVCLQETKVSDPEFPKQKIAEMEFPFVEFSGEKSYNGVALLSKKPLQNLRYFDVLSYGHKRHIAAKINLGSISLDLHNFYVPAGGDLPDSALNAKFDHKLKFVDWMAEFFATNQPTSKTSGFVVLGDFNIAPLPNDVWSHRQMQNVVSHTEIEVEKLNNLMRRGNFIDSHRFFTDEAKKLFSWWSYRAKEPLVSNRGRRLDHIWVSKNLQKHLKSTKIHRDFRVKNQPSDHVPIELNLSL